MSGKAGNNSRRKNIIFTIITLVLFAAILEGGARTYDYFKWRKVTRHRMEQPSDDTYGPYMRIKFRRHPFLYRTFAPGQHAGCFNINSRGYRGREFDTLPAEDTYRILTTGGSVAFGVLLNSDEDTISDSAERALNAGVGAGRKFEVLNLAVLAYASTQELFLTETYGLKLKPDMVVSITGYNDFGYKLAVDWEPFYPPYYKRIPGGEKAFIDNPDDPANVPNSVLFGIIYQKAAAKSSFFRKMKTQVEGLARRDAFSERRAAEIKIDPAYEKDSVNIWLDNIKSEAEMLHSRGIKYVVVLQPSFFNEPGKSAAEKDVLTFYEERLGADYIRRSTERYKRAAAGARELARDGSFVFLDYSEFRLPGGRKTFIDLCHMNEEANRAMGAKLAADIAHAYGIKP